MTISGQLPFLLLFYRSVPYTIKSMTNEKKNGTAPQTESPDAAKKRLRNLQKERDKNDFYKQLRALTPDTKAKLLELIKIDIVGASLFHAEIQDIPTPVDDPELAAVVLEVKAAAEASSKIHTDRFDPNDGYKLYSKPKPLY